MKEYDWNISSREERYKLAREFVSNLSVKVLRWYVGGSTARGTHRPSSDIDVFVLFEKDEDIPVFSDEELGPIDFHSFAADWAVYRLDQRLLKEWEKYE